MSDLKSKLPDVNEISSMASKLYKDVKKSVTEIIADYKANHPNNECADASKEDDSSKVKDVDVKDTHAEELPKDKTTPNDTQ